MSEATNQIDSQRPDEASELEAMRRMLSYSAGTSSFSVAICNSRPHRDRLIRELQKDCPDSKIIDLAGADIDPLGFTRRQLGDVHPSALFFINLDEHVDSRETQFPYLRSLNATRELWRKYYTCPVVFWTPEYAATLLSIHARDLWSWVSHHFEFVQEDTHGQFNIEKMEFGDVSVATNLSAEQKHIRAIELETRISELGSHPEAKMSPFLVSWLNELAIIKSISGELHKAVEYWEQALMVARNHGDKYSEDVVIGNLGTAYVYLGEIQKAINYFLQGLALDREIGDKAGELADLGNLGNVYAILGQNDRSAEYYQQALTISREVGDQQGEANSLGNLGIQHLRTGNPNEAIRFHNQALAIYEAINDKRGIANSLCNLGRSYATLDEIPRAIEFYQRALNISREIGDLRIQGTILLNMGNAYKKNGETRRAIEHYVKRLEIARRIDDQYGIANTLFNLSLAYGSLGEREPAILHATEALSVFEKIKSPEAEKTRVLLSNLQQK